MLVKHRPVYRRDEWCKIEVRSITSDRSTGSLALVPYTKGGEEPGSESPQKIISSKHDGMLHETLVFKKIFLGVY